MALIGLVAALLVWAALAIPSAIYVWRVEPYMDEVFHIPQAQRYCQGRFLEWDPKITTFPGLYVCSAVLSWAARPLLPHSSTCSATSLRALNLLFGAGSLVVLYKLLRRRMSGGKAAFQALALSLYPVHFFFTFLYYTDVGSLFWVLLAQHLAAPAPGRARPSPGRVAAAAAAGLAAIAFRQTNAVWLMFVFGTAALGDLEASKRWGEALAAGRPAGGAAPAPTPALLAAFVRALLLESRGLLRRLGALLLPVALFAAFVCWNGSVVVGDHANHGAVAHWAQLAYLSAVTASLWGAVGPDAAVSRSTGKAFAASCLGSFRAALAFLAVVGGVAALLHRYSLAHPFLLADNRHYTFYVWRRFLGGIPGLKEALAPAYVYSAWLCHRQLVREQSVLWLLIWLVAAVLTLVPAHLVEPRYLTTAVVLAHAHAPERTWTSLLAGAGACVLVNAGTLAVFAGRPFVWPDGSLARFMW